MTKLELGNIVWSIGMYVVGMLILWIGLALIPSHTPLWWCALFVGGTNAGIGILTKERPKRNEP